MVGKVLGESLTIYKRRFGIVLFFSFIFFALGYTAFYGAILAVSQAMSGFSMDIINIAVRLVKGTPIENLFYGNPPFMNPDSVEIMSMPLYMLAMFGVDGLMITYGVLAVPIGMGGLTVLSSGVTGPLSSRSIFTGIKQRYSKLLVTYLCYMVYAMGAGFAFMFVYMIAAVLIAIAVPLIIMGAGAGIAAGVVLITLAVLLILAGYMVVMVLSVFIAPAAVFDRQYNFKAVGTSIKMAWKHFFPVLGVQAVTMLSIGLVSILLFGVFFAIAWSGPSLPIYAPLWYASIFTLAWPFSVIVNGVLYRHIQERDEQMALEIPGEM